MPFPNEETQFKPGQSGNPGGYSKKRRLTNALAKMLDEDEGGEVAFVMVGYSAAKAGDFNFWRYCFDRIDGKIPDAEEQPDLELKEFARKLKERIEKKKK